MFAAVKGISDADALRHGDALHGSPSPLRGRRPGDAGRKRFDGDWKMAERPPRRNAASSSSGEAAQIGYGT